MICAVKCCLLGAFLLITVNAQGSRSWSAGLDILMKNCLPPKAAKTYQIFDALRSCLQKRALIAMDAVLSTDVIPILSGIELVRYKEGVNRTSTTTDTDRSSSSTREMSATWRERVLGRFAKIFKTHVLKVDIDVLTGKAEPNTQDENADAVVEGRRRHRKRNNNIMSMMMMGLMLMGSVLIPMGFQFLAVLGGKALILAKLALMLSSIQGLKRIATSGVNYGLYHAPSDGWHERSQVEYLGPYEAPYPPYPRM